jgi:Tfp pilus assembly protein PilO
MSALSVDLNKLPKSYLKLVGMGLLLLLWIGLLVWQMGEIFQRQEELSTAQAEQQRLEGVQMQNRALEERLKALTQRWEAQRVRLPSTEDYAGLVRLIGDTSRALGVEVGALQLVVVQGKSAFPYLSTPLELSGPFPKVLALMNALQQQGRAIILREVTVELEEAGNVRAKMVLEAYYEKNDLPSALPPARPSTRQP